MASCNPYLFRARRCLELIPTCSGARGCLVGYHYIFSNCSGVPVQSRRMSRTNPHLIRNYSCLDVYHFSPTVQELEDVGANLQLLKSWRRMSSTFPRLVRTGGHLAPNTQFSRNWMMSNFSLTVQELQGF
jgi:hypothetical protein